MAWAFWKYDTPPYYLGDEIQSYDPKKNLAKLANYGNMIVCPKVIIEDDNEGLKLWLKIKNIGDTTTKSATMLRRACRIEVEESLGLTKN